MVPKYKLYKYVCGCFRIQSLVEHDLYTNWLNEGLTNVTACLKAPTSTTVKEAYGIVGLWVRRNNKKLLVHLHLHINIFRNLAKYELIEW